MSLGSIKHNKAVIRQLKKVVLEDKISHAYLFVGEASTRRELGIEFSKAILCTESPDDNCDECVVCRKINHGNHEDVIFIDKDGSSIKTEAIENLISSISYKSIGARTVIIMDSADRMTVAAQNKLLKTLEDPAGNSIIILLAERKNALKDTIISRCVSFYLQEGEVFHDSRLSSVALEFIKLCVYGAAYYKKKHVLEDLISDRIVCLNFLDLLEEKLRVLLLIKADVPILLSENDKAAFFEEVLHVDVAFIQRAITALEDTRKAIQKNYNISYAIKWLCLRMDDRRLMEE
jgi:DNA polymerase-3 subunit delta'